MSVAQQSPAMQHSLLVKRYRFFGFAHVVVQYRKIVHTVQSTYVVLAKHATAAVQDF